VTNLKDRQRAAARARLEREMAARQENAAHRRRRRNGILGGIGVLAVIGVVVGIVVATTGGTPAKTPAVAASQAAAKCTWTPNPALKGDAQNPVDKQLVNTGPPPLSTVPHNGSQQMTLNTTQGKIVITLNVSKAPCSAESMSFLTGKKFFDNTKCHRLTTSGIYVLQCGDPSGTGMGGPSYTYASENLPTDQQPNYPAGVVAMANPGNKNLNGSQFFIVYQDTPETADETGAMQSNLTSDYTIIGTVTTGLDTIQKVGKAGVIATDKTDPNDGTPKLPVTIKTATIGPVQP
jgi:peptidyl-prolyl cis-trans isomerase B (cyclophilin B)